MTELLNKVAAGDRRALTKALSALMTNRNDEQLHKAIAKATTTSCYSVGITGPPGAGKSTLVNSLIKELRKHDATIAVLALDPTSPISGGAILGDRIRMTEHCIDRNVFIRSLSSEEELHGLPTSLPSMLKLLSIFGFDYCLVETIGSGQLDCLIDLFVDTTLLVLTPEGGDEIQAMKAGILEICDIIAINKGDRPGARRLADQMKSWQNLAANKRTWTAPVLIIEASNNKGIDALVAELAKHRKLVNEQANLRGTKGHGKQREVQLLINLTLSLFRKRLLECSQSGGFKRIQNELLPDHLLEAAEQLVRFCAEMTDSASN